MKKILSLIMMLAILLTVAVFPMQVSAATTIKSGKTVSDSVDPKHPMEYKFTSGKEGTLTLKISPRNYDISIWVFEANGKEIGVSKVTNAESYGVVKGGNNGVLEYNIKKGDYRIIIKPQSRYSDRIVIAYDMTATFPTAKEESSDASQSTSTVMGAELKKGATLQLVGPSSNCTWKSSKEDVATVSASGKVTAVKKGSSTITATDGKTSLKIKIIVL